MLLIATLLLGNQFGNSGRYAASEVGYLYHRHETAEFGACITSTWLGMKDGRSIPVELTASARAGLQGFATEGYVELDGQTVQGRFVAGRATAIPPESVSGIYADPILKSLIPKDAFSKVRSQFQTDASVPVTENRKYLNVCVRFQDSGAKDPHPMSWYTQVMRNTYPGLDHYYQTDSYGHLSLTGPQVLGWITLPGKQADYIVNHSYDVGKMITDAIPLIDPSVDFRTIWGVNVFPHEDDNSGFTYATSALIKSAETNWWRPVTMLNPWTDQWVMVHEDGHNFGFDHSSIPGSVYNSRWSPMGNGGRTWSNTYPDFTMIACSHNSYHKVHAGWVQPTEVGRSIAGQTSTFRIERIEIPSKPGLRQVRAFLPGRGSKYFSIESRRFSGYETAKSLPGEAVVIHYIDLAQAWNPGASRLVDKDPKDTGGGAGAMWIKGQTFSDPTSGIQISVVDEDTTGFTVKVVNPPSALQSGVVSNSTDSDAGSLREAMIYAQENANTTVQFNLPKTDPSFVGGVFKIALVSPLPVIVQDGTVIDGRSQTLKTGDTNAGGPEVYLDFSKAGNTHGLTVNAAHCIVQGIGIGKPAYSGIWAEGAANLLVRGCQIGLTPDGTAAAGCGWAAVALINSSGSVIGGSSIADRNVLSASGAGCVLNGAASTKNNVTGNWLGLSASGKSTFGNVNQGIRIDGGANTNTLNANVICGNQSDGIKIWDATTFGNFVTANLIGIMPDGKTVAGNYSGVAIGNGSYSNTVGGTSVAKGNIAVGSKSDGFRVMNSAHDNTVQFNFSGCTPTAASGTFNAYAGIAIFYGANKNIVKQNVFSGNHANGIYLAGVAITPTQPNSTANTISSNIVGLDPTGSLTWSNSGAGCYICNGAASNTIASNTLSGNLGDGMDVTDSGTNTNTLSTNRIGTNPAGILVFKNGGANVWVGNGASSNQFVGNTVAGSVWDGIYVHGIKTANNLFSKNVVGKAGSPTFANRIGIWLDGTGPQMVSQNVVTGNNSVGVYVSGVSEGVTISQNQIFGNAKLGIDLAGRDGNYGVTPNDPLDADTGPNDLTNFPVISISGTGTARSAQIVLAAKPNTAYRVELFQVLHPDPSGYGGGDIYLGSVDLTTDAAGNATAKSGLVAGATKVCGTATEKATGSTSEFGPISK